MTVVVVAGSHYLAEQAAHDLGIAHPISRHCVVVTPNLSPRALLGSEVTAVHLGHGASEVPVEFWDIIRSRCRDGWPGPGPEPMTYWPRAKKAR